MVATVPYKAHRRHWTEAEAMFVRLAYPLFDLEDIANTINRSKQGVKQFVCVKNFIVNPSIKIGDTYGRLTVTGLHSKHIKYGHFWKCVCTCGNTTKATSNGLKRGHTTSCGCKLNEYRKTKCYGVITGTFFSRAKRNAITRNIPFSLTMEYINDLWFSQDGKCALSGIRLDITSRTYDQYEGTASIDRIDSSKSYEPGNVQIVHKMVNIMKGTLSQDEFIEWCDLISSNAKCCKFNTTVGHAERRRTIKSPHFSNA